jgi:hypothetical protein
VLLLLLLLLLLLCFNGSQLSMPEAEPAVALHLSRKLRR